MKTKSFKGKFLRNCTPSQKVEADWKFENAVNGGVLEWTEKQSLPAEKDLRFPGWTIHDQGETGGCVGWALADGLLKWHFVQAGRMQASDTFSPRFIWMAAKETDEYTMRPTSFLEREGTSIKAGLDVAKKYGAAPNKLLPHNSKNLFTGKLADFYIAASKFRINSYINLECDFDKMRKWIAFHGPVIARLALDKTWDSPGKKGLLENYVPTSEQHCHAVVIAGYTTDHFIIRNSWGSSWGNKGYGFASTDYLKKALEETYGVIL